VANTENSGPVKRREFLHEAERLSASQEGFYSTELMPVGQTCLVMKTIMHRHTPEMARFVWHFHHISGDHLQLILIHSVKLLVTSWTRSSILCYHSNFPVHDNAQTGPRIHSTYSVVTQGSFRWSKAAQTRIWQLHMRIGITAGVIYGFMAWHRGKLPFFVQYLIKKHPIQETRLFVFRTFKHESHFAFGPLFGLT
jgi:hypothetical protein